MRVTYKIIKILDIARDTMNTLKRKKEKSRTKNIRKIKQQQ